MSDSSSGHQAFLAYLALHEAEPQHRAVTGEGGTWSYEDLLGLVGAWSSELRELGVGDRTVVATSLENGPELVALLIALWEVGAAVSPLNPLLGREERKRSLERLAPGFFLAGPDVAVEAVADGAACGVVMVDDRSLRILRAGISGRLASPGTAVILHTSGTSGPAKAVELSAAGIIGALDSVLRLLGAAGRSSTPGKRRAPNLIAFPLSHLAGLYNLLLALRNHREVLLMPRFEVEKFIVLVETHRIPSVVLNPTMIYMLVEADDVDPERLASLRFVRSGSAPLSPSVIHRFRERFGVPILNGYGQTETFGEIIGWKASDLEFWPDKCGSIGRVHPGVTLRFVDEELREVPAGEVGELCARAAFVSPAYLVGDSAPLRLDGGFLRTGDLGYIDGDGFVWLVGRRNDVVNCGGFKVLPEEVEEVLRHHEAVLDVMVAGVPDERLGEAPHAFVVRRDGVDPQRDLDAELREYAREHLAHYKAPRRVHLIESLPRNAMGKLVRSRAAGLAESLTVVLDDPEERGLRLSGDGLTLAASVWGDERDPLVVLLHGGGQTRHAWGDTGRALARAGFRAVSLDARGHGESDWAPDADYGPERSVADLAAVVDQLGAPAALVGASAGGMTALVGVGEGQVGAGALVLVDVVPLMERDGAKRVRGFMSSRPDGFSSLDEAAEAVAAYLPRRARPVDPAGLRKNLRLGDDGRWRWHWDPRILAMTSDWRDLYERLSRAARGVTVPTLLVRGQDSDIVSARGVEDFLESVPHAEFFDVAGAGHMVAGDQNDLFTVAIVEFLSRLIKSRSTLEEVG